MPKVSEAHLESRRNHILEAAARSFSRNGFHGTTILAICEEAELSTGAVYRYFKSKDEIVAAIAEVGIESTRGLLEAARTAGAATRSLAEMARAGVDVVHFDGAEMSNRLSLLLWGESLHTPQIRELLVRALAELALPFAAEAERGKRRGEIDGDLDPASIGRVLAALSIGFTVLAAIDPQPHADTTRVISALLTGAFAKEGSPQ